MRFCKKQKRDMRLRNRHQLKQLKLVGDIGPDLFSCGGGEEKRE